MSDVLRARAVVFDVGETLVDETAEYGTWADWLGVPRHTFSAVFGAVIARGADHREAFRHFRPGFELAAARLERERAGLPERLTRSDLYDDAVPCLAALRRRGFMVGVAGNQTARAEGLLEGLGLPADWIRTSASLAVDKPSPAFFAAVADECGCPPGRIVYVGDRLDNDVLPALAAGMQAAFLRRGPWGHVHADRPDAARAHLRLDSLADLPGHLVPLT
jgi:HAD superfamily hydrolase (TIGR01549 family)